MTISIQEYTDNNIKNATPTKEFILFTSSNFNYLEQITQINNLVIYRFNKSLFSQFSNYLLLGDMILYDNIKSYKVLMVKNKGGVSTYPHDYKKVHSFSSTNIWQPISDNKYGFLGLVASITKPNVRMVAMVKNKYIKRIINHSDGQIHSMNKYNFINIRDLNSYSLNDSDNSSYVNSYDPYSQSITSINPTLTYQYNNIYSTSDIPWFVPKGLSTASKTLTSKVKKNNYTKLLFIFLALFILYLMYTRIVI
jgi:hypothetical protein